MGHKFKTMKQANQEFNRMVVESKQELRSGDRTSIFVFRNRVLCYLDSEGNPHQCHWDDTIKERSINRILTEDVDVQEIYYEGRFDAYDTWADFFSGGDYTPVDEHVTLTLYSK